MQCSSVMLSSFEMKCTTDIENLKYFISENSKTIPDFFVNTFWKDWIVDKVWNQFIVGTIWNKGLLPAWNWINGESWYQIILKNIVMAVVSAGVGALIGLIAGPQGAFAGAIIGLIIGILWDFGVSGINP